MQLSLLKSFCHELCHVTRHIDIKIPATLIRVDRHSYGTKLESVGVEHGTPADIGWWIDPIIIYNIGDRCNCPVILTTSSHDVVIIIT